MRVAAPLCRDDGIRAGLHDCSIAGPQGHLTNRRCVLSAAANGDNMKANTSADYHCILGFATQMGGSLFDRCVD